MAATDGVQNMEVEEPTTLKRLCVPKRIVLAVAIVSVILLAIISLTVFLLTAGSNGKATKPTEPPLKNSTGAEEASNRTITCPGANLPTVTNGSFDCASDSNVKTGETCILRCADGFYPPFSNQTTCKVGPTKQGGRWSDGRFMCDAMVCSTTQLPNVTGGSFDCNPHTGVLRGDFCTLTCHDELYPAFTYQAVCEEGISNQGGMWSYGNLSCQRVECNGWNQWNGSAYKVNRTRVTWDDSRQLCEEDSSHLIIIDNEDENQFVRKMIRNCQLHSSVWIGFNSADGEGIQKRSDSAVSGYGNWIGDPQVIETGNNCAGIYVDNGKWYGTPCSYEFSTICERNNSLIR